MKKTIKLITLLTILFTSPNLSGQSTNEGKCEDGRVSYTSLDASDKAYHNERIIKTVKILNDKIVSKYPNSTVLGYTVEKYNGRQSWTYNDSITFGYTRQRNHVDIRICPMITHPIKIN